MNKTNYFKGELTTIEEDLILEETMQKSNEVDSGDFDTWFEDNLVDIQEAFIQDHKELLKEYAKENWKGVR